MKWLRTSPVLRYVRSLLVLVLVESTLQLSSLSLVNLAVDHMPSTDGDCPSPEFTDRYSCPDCASGEDAWDFTEMQEWIPRKNIVLVPPNGTDADDIYVKVDDGCVSAQNMKVFECDRATRICTSLGKCEVKHVQSTDSLVNISISDCGTPNGSSSDE